MDNIKKEVEDILKDKGFAPGIMSDAAFNDEVMRRLAGEMTGVVAAAVERIGNELISEELRQLGRELPCRQVLTNGKNCPPGQSCYECSKYKPIPWRLRHPLKFMVFLNIVAFAIVLFSFIAVIIVPEIRPLAVTSWFMIFFLSRVEAIYLYTRIYPPGKWKPARWLGLKIKHVTVTQE